MNIQEHLLTCIMEEAAEVQQAAAKALRFGSLDGYPGSETTNMDDLAHEMTDLIAVVELAKQYGVPLPEYGGPDQIAEKQDKVNHMTGYAIQQGTLVADS